MKSKKIVGCLLVLYMFLIMFSPSNTGAKAAQSNPARIWGEDRYKTAVQASVYGWESAENVVLATGDDYPDALCAAPLAKHLNAPILLTGKAYLDAATGKEIDRLGAENIFIIGGAGVISDDVKNELESVGRKVWRLWGEDRYETSLSVARYIIENFDTSSELAVATGEEFSDALSISPVAAQKDMILLLAPKEGLSQNVLKFVEQNNFTNTYIVGGTDIISDGTAAKFPNPERICGNDKYDRNIAVLTKFSDDIKFDRVYIATGEAYPDALAGSVLASKTKSAILLTGTTPSNSTQEFINSRNSSIKEINILGGEGAVSSDAVNMIMPLNWEAPASYPNVFKGYFNNTVYDNPGYFLYSGEQTKADDNIKNIAEDFNDKRDMSTLAEIFRWMRANLVYGDGEKFARTAAQIIAEKKFTGCTDMGLAFAALARSKGIPSVFVQTARIDWINKLVNNDPESRMITGHILVEVCLSDNKWYLVDSTAGKLFLDYDKENMSLPDGYYVFAKSIEVWDSGVDNERENHNVMMDIFRDFDVKKYINPKYDYMDILSGSRRKSGDFTGNSLVIGNAAVILGDRFPVEAFSDKFFNGCRCECAGEWVIKESGLTTADTLIGLHIKGNSVPDFLKKYLPDIDSGESGSIYKYVEDGQKRALIIGSSEDDLVRIVEGLPDDFLHTIQ